MADFDPNTYIAEKSAKAAPFDPQQYIAEKTAMVMPTPAKEGIDFSTKGIPQSIIRGGAQGITFNNADEAAAVPGALWDYVQGKLGNRGDISLADAYQTRRDAIRKADVVSREAHPAVFTGAQIGGGILGTVGPGLLAKGALEAAGASEAIGLGQEAKTAADALNGAPGLAERLGQGARTLAGYGALSGAGAAKNWTDIPSDAIHGAGTNVIFGLPFQAAGEVAAAGAKKVGPFLANVLGGVKPSDYAKYAESPEAAARITAAGQLPDDAVKDAVDGAVQNVMATKTSAAEKASQIEQSINAGYAAKQAELAGSVTPLAKAKEMVGALESQKSYLQSLSQQADDALVRSGATFDKGDLLNAIDKIGTSKGAAIGDEAHSALSRLQATRDRIAQQLPDQISAPDMRSVLQQLRKDINFDQSAGEFNDTLNGMRKDFAAKISGALKNASPEYAHYMDRMSDLAQNLSTMDRYFGDENKAIGALETLRKGGAKAQLIEDALKNHATINGDQTMLEQLAQIRQNQALLSRIKQGEDLRPALFPEAWNALQEANNGAQNAENIAAPIERLGPNRTQAVIKNMGGNNVNIEDRRALEALGQITGDNYPQMISDKNVAAAFKKGDLQGGRKAIMGTAMGAGLGGTIFGPTGAYVGGGIGGFLGGTADKYGPAMTKAAIDTSNSLRNMLSSSAGIQKLGDFAAPLMEAAQHGGAALATTNAYLYATSPEYRKILEKEQQKSAILRRLGE